jgi:hypothetical protein
MGTPGRARTVRYSATANDQIGEIEPDAARFDEVLRGVEWAIATNPEECYTIPRTDVRVIKTRFFPQAPPLLFYFVIDDENHATVLEVHRSPEAEEEDATD